MKKPEMLSNGVFLIQDNAQSHKHELVQHLIDSFVCELFPHPAYYPDAAPSDFHALPGLKHLAGKRFSDEETLHTAAR